MKFPWFGFSPTDPMKHLYRERGRAIREQAARDRPDASVHAARIFLDHIQISENDVVALYSAINAELNPQPLTRALHERGTKIALPVVTAKNKPMIFRELTTDTELVKGKFDVPVPTQEAAQITPTIIVTPLLAFSRTGERIGYGGGYYDRTLAHLRAKGAIIAVGYGYGAQEVDAFTAGKLDQPLDWIITEREAIQI